MPGSQRPGSLQDIRGPPITGKALCSLRGCVDASMGGPPSVKRTSHMHAGGSKPTAAFVVAVSGGC